MLEGKTTQYAKRMEHLTSSAGMDCERALKSVINLMEQKKLLAQELLKTRGDEKEVETLNDALDLTEKQIKAVLAIN